MHSMKAILAAGSAAIVLALVVPVTSWAARTETIYNPDPIAVPCNNLSADKIRGVVREAFLGRGWVPNDKGANALAAKLKKAGHPAYTEPYETSRGRVWRVRVGPYPTREAAESARIKLKSEGHNGILAAAK